MWPRILVSHLCFVHFSLRHQLTALLKTAGTGCAYVSSQKCNSQNCMGVRLCHSFAGLWVSLPMAANNEQS